MSDLQILVANAIAYTGVLVYVLNRKRQISIGLCLWSLFTFSAWMSCLFYNHKLFIESMHNNPIHADALIYLFFTLLLFISPFFKAVKFKKKDIVIEKFSLLKIIIILYALWMLLVLVINFNVVTNILSLETTGLADMRDNMYESTNSRIVHFPLLNRINLIASGFHPIAIGLSLFLLICYQKHRNLVKIFFLASMTSVFLDVVIQVSRGIIVCNFIYITTILLYLRDYLDNKVKRKLFIYVVPLIVLGVLFFFAISVSRFGDLAEYMMYKYPGEPMVNFSGILFPDIKGNTYGSAYLLSAFRDDFLSGEEKWAYLEGITHVPSYIFYTFVGGFIIEFGKLPTLLIALSFFVFERQIIRKYSQDFCFVFIFCFFIFFYGYGTFLFILQKFMGLFNILFTCFLFMYYKKKFKR